MKNIIKIAFFAFLLVRAEPAASQIDTVIYTGINGRLTGLQNANVKKEIRFKSSEKGEIRVYRKSDHSWTKSYTEQISVGDDKSYYQIKTTGKGVTGLIIRKYVDNQNGQWKFTEFEGHNPIRTGSSLLKFPILLQGEVLEYYPDGKLKSKSQYLRNELISNENWLENGDKYIDSVFYSVDEEPTLFGGSAWIHQHVRKAFADTRLDFSSVSGNILLGFVVMETGEIAGIRVIKGLSDQLNNIAVHAIKTLNGKWQPARLNGKVVRYFQLFPINFISAQDLHFDYMEFDGTMIHYNKN